MLTPVSFNLSMQYKNIQVNSAGLKNKAYLDNFLTNPMYILAYSGDSASESHEYAIKTWG